LENLSKRIFENFLLKKIYIKIAKGTAVNLLENKNLTWKSCFGDNEGIKKAYLCGDSNRAFFVVAGHFFGGRRNGMMSARQATMEWNYQYFQRGGFSFLMDSCAGHRRYYGADTRLPLSGVGSGIGLGAIIYGILVLFIERSSSVIHAHLSDRSGITVPIDANGTGEVGISAGERYRAYSARSKDSSAIAKGKQVKVVESSGSILIVEEIK
jgi:hypothetical protein